jgi:polyprenyl-phospho-N-acetylgalactosaminyl synthase
MSLNFGERKEDIEVSASDNGAVWVIIPVYNEETVIADVVADVRSQFPNVICVDDGSSDRSASVIARTLAHLVKHPINLGQGAALETGLQYALSQPRSCYFVTFDADGQHRVADAAMMVEAAKHDEADVILGSRFMTSQVPPLKRFVLTTAAHLSPASRRLHLTDAHNGLRVLNRTAAEQIRITQNGMAHASEVIAKLAASTLRVKEKPMTVLYTNYSRAKGQSLFNGINIVSDLFFGKEELR